MGLREIMCEEAVHILPQSRFVIKEYKNDSY